MIKSIHIFLIAAAIGLLVHLPGYAQHPLSQTLNNLQKQDEDYPVEKVYLHMDRPFYGAGDTVWFKAYVVTGAAHQLSGLSGVLNVELINQQNLLVRHIRLPLINGITRGDFVLGDTVTEGNYRIRAYTNWMRNAGAEYFFDKTFRIVNVAGNHVFTHTTFTYPIVNGQQTVNADIIYSGLDKSAYVAKEVTYEINLGSRKIKGKGITDDKGMLHITFVNPSPDKQIKGNVSTHIALDNQHVVNKIIALKAANAHIDVQFFPESGYLVNGLLSKVAFKAVASDGLGSDISGTITDDQNNEITPFASTHLGMGYFFLMPEAGKTYKAHITYVDGTTGVVDLPKAFDKGNVMTIHSDSTHVIVKIDRKGDQNIADSLTLLVDAGGEIYAQAQGHTGKISFTAAVLKNKLPSGIVRFTLFSGSGEPLNERLVFVRNPDTLSLSLHTANNISTNQRKVKIDLNAKAPDGSPVEGNFSVAVIDGSKIPLDETAESTMYSTLLLTSDIRGYIEKPNYYFTNSNKKTAVDLDILMMTQGYHRYEWKQIIDGKKPDIIYPYQKTLSIAGVVESPDGTVLSNSKLTLINNTTKMLLDTTTDKSGRFAFNLDFKDSTKFALKASAVNGENFLVKLDDQTAPVTENKNTPDELVNLDEGVDAYLQNSKSEHDVKVKYHIGDHSTLLKEVNVKAGRLKTEKELKIERAVEFSSNLNGKGVADQVITSDVFDGMGCPSTHECLLGKVHGITFDIYGRAHTPRAGSINSSTIMRLYVDGVLSASGSVDDIDPHEISSIEVLVSAGNTAIYGSFGANGVLIVTTKHGGSFITNNFHPGNISPQGYYKAREFYSPKYEPAAGTIPDLRATTYWKPILQTDKDGNASFEYINTDSKGPYRVVVEGIDYKSGNIGRQVLTYLVPSSAQ